MLRKVFVGSILLLFFVGPACADSPLTSTGFWKAYSDVPQVATAHDIGRLTTKLAQYLSSTAPIDRKAAVINALSWDCYGKQNAALFREVLGQKYKCAPSAVDGRLAPDETFCLAYLVALDDYFHPQPAVRLAGQARQRLPRSFTVAVVTMLMQAQIEMHANHWDRIWPMTRAVLDDRGLRADMRPAARDIIVAYMRLYNK